MQYIPCNSALRAKKHCFWLKKALFFLARDLQKVRKLQQILICDKIAYVQAKNFRPSPNFSAGATCAPTQLLPPCPSLTHLACPLLMILGQKKHQILWHRKHTIPWPAISPNVTLLLFVWWVDHCRFSEFASHLSFGNGCGLPLLSWWIWTINQNCNQI